MNRGKKKPKGSQKRRVNKNATLLYTFSKEKRGRKKKTGTKKMAKKEAERRQERSMNKKT